MTHIARALFLVTVGAAFCSRASAQEHHSSTSAQAAADLGDITFPNSGSFAAQPHFIRGVLLLHSFQYAEAAEAFRSAQRADSGFAMAYWGEAMAYNRSLWAEQNRAAATQALERLGSSPQARLAKAPTDREKAYLGAVHALYGEGVKRERDAAYAREMERLAAMYPEDLEARAFYALAILASGGRTRDLANYMRAAAIAEEIFAINPRHPGAAHLLIHAYDDPVHAPLGLRAARAYATLAPSSAHALHMPAHIFFALGHWDEVIDANVRSLAAERRAGRVGTHAMHWLVYAYLQQGRRDEAAALLRTLEGDLKRSDFSRSAGYPKAQICAVWVTETGSDRDAPCAGDIARSVTAIGPFIEYEFARGLVAARRGDLTGAKQSLNKMRNLLTEGRAAVRPDAAASRVDQVTEREMELGAMVTLELDAAILFAEGKRPEGVKRALEAVAAEQALTSDAEPPAVPKPPRELAGELLLAAGRFEEARQQFEAALARTPGRMLTMTGLLQALERTGDVSRASHIRTQLQKQWRRGSPPPA